MHRTLSVRLSVRPSRYRCLFGPASVTGVLFGTHRGPHIVRPSRPHRFLLSTFLVLSYLFVLLLYYFYFVCISVFWA